MAEIPEEMYITTEAETFENTSDSTGDLPSESTYFTENTVEITPELISWKAGISEYEIVNVVQNVDSSVVETDEVEMPSRLPETVPVQSEIVSTTSVETTAQSTTVATTTVTTTESTTVTTTETTTESTTESTTEPTTESTTESTTETTTESSSEATSSETEQSEDIQVPDVSGEILSVTDLSTGRIVSGSAYDIVCQIVANEINDSMNEEAIKAQAVAAYSYVKFYNELGSSPQVGLRSSASLKIQNCVNEVLGVAVYYNGKVALTPYYASSAGSTAWCYDVYKTNYPYLVEVESVYDELYDPNYGVTKVYSIDEMRSQIENNTDIVLSSSPENWFSIHSYLSGNMVGSMTIDGNSTFVQNGKSYEITGRNFREKIMKFGIRSSSFDISFNGSEFVITTYGYGHGVGMPQNGANFYAVYGGYDYVQILEHFYVGTEVR